MQKVNVVSFGAIPDGSLCTDAIQSAIDYCFEQGGGTVEIPAGTFLTGGIRLRNNITLLLRKNACLKGTRDPEAYMAFLSDPIEPIPDEYLSSVPWTHALEWDAYDFIRKPASRWSNGLIRAIDAQNISIIGEEGSIIDGSDCYDEIGEEGYRGPHGISMHGCSNLYMSGYTIQNTGNWAHALFDCKDICIKKVTVLAGHDGVHLTTCDRAVIQQCEFYTGDDCVAGIDNVDIHVSDCILNTACSAFRFGGRNVQIEHCKIFGPARYLFRGSLTKEEKQLGQPPVPKSGHRYNMLSAFTYYADFSRHIRGTQGNIVMQDCEVSNVDRFVHYNYSGNEPWQRNKPLEQICFRRVRASGLRMPLTLYGDAEKPVSCSISDCSFAFERDDPQPFIHLCNYKQLQLHNVTISGAVLPVIKRWSNEGTIHMEGIFNDHSIIIDDVTEPFVCTPI